MERSLEKDRRRLEKGWRRGISLIEVLVAVTIFSIVVAAVMRFSDYVSRRIFTVRNEVQQMNNLVTFLQALSADVRGCRQILYSAPLEIGIWRADENADSVPEPLETTGYAWDGASPGSVYRRDGEDSAVVLSAVQEFKFSYDREGPQTRHILLDLSVGQGATGTGDRYHFSLNLRASELK